MATESAIGRDLARVVGAENVLEPPAARFLHDETWRDGVSIVVTTLRGGKVSEDIVVPFERLSEAIAETVEIGKAPRPASLQLGPCRRRQAAFDVHGQPDERG